MVLRICVSKFTLVLLSSLFALYYYFLVGEKKIIHGVIKHLGIRDFLDT